MNDLLELAVEAHGGLKRWSQLTTVKASLSGLQVVLEIAETFYWCHHDHTMTHFCRIDGRLGELSSAL